MSPKERLIRYFELVQKGANKNSGECQEMWHLEEALIDDMDEFMQLKEKDHND